MIQNRVHPFATGSGAAPRVTLGRSQVLEHVFSTTSPVPPRPFGDFQRYRGVRLVASAAKDVEDCVLLLAILGLDPADGLER